jgi:glycerol-3-phosphate dehydrogenase
LAGLKARGEAIVPALAGIDITATYAGLRPATEHKDYQIRVNDGQNLISVGGIRSTGLTSALGTARHVFELYRGLGSSHAPLTSPVWPKAAPISEAGERRWQQPDNGGIVCHCELVTRAEVEETLSGPLAPQTLAGLKRRTRVTMGRCQGFYCSAELARMTAGRLSVPMAGKAYER